MTKTQQIETFKCIKCGEISDVLPVAHLPKGGLLMRAKHHNNTEDHRWVEYDDIEDFGSKPKKSTKTPIRLRCPRCEKIGQVSEYYLTIDKFRPENIRFYFRHEKIPGRWGSRKNYAKFKRHYIHNQEQVYDILKKLEQLRKSK